MNLKHGFVRMFGCSSRSLSMFRVSLGALLTMELLLRFRFLHPFYSNEGTFPLSILMDKVDPLYKYVCLHCYHDALRVQQVLLVIQVGFACALTLGYHTRVVTLVSWILYVSSTLRNTWLSFILDRYFHYLLFYAILLPPLDQHYTLASRHDLHTVSRSQYVQTVVGILHTLYTKWLPSWLVAVLDTIFTTVVWIVSNLYLVVLAILLIPSNKLIKSNTRMHHMVGLFVPHALQSGVKGIVQKFHSSLLTLFLLPPRLLVSVQNTLYYLLDDNGNGNDNDNNIKKKKREKENLVENESNKMVLTPATMAFKLFVAWIYFDAGYGKYSDPLQGWSLHPGGSDVDDGGFHLSALDTYTRHTLFARIIYTMLQPINGFQYLTPSVVYVELFITPVTLLFSFCNFPKAVRYSIFVIWSMHFGISLCIRNANLLSYTANTVWFVFFIPPSACPPETAAATPATKTHTAATTATKLSSSKMDHTDTNMTTTTSTTNNNKKYSNINTIVSTILILSMFIGNLWFALLSESCDQSQKHIWSTLLHNRWNVFVGAEEYVTWEIAPGLLDDGSVVDIWAGKDKAEEPVNWKLPGTGAASTASNSRPGRWRSFPYLAEFETEEEYRILWEYLCYQWNTENDVYSSTFKSNRRGRQLVKFNFFMLQADVLPNMGFSNTRKRLIKSHECIEYKGKQKKNGGNNITKQEEERKQPSAISRSSFSSKEEL